MLETGWKDITECWVWRGENARRQSTEQVVGTRYESPETRRCISDVHRFVSFLIVVTLQCFGVYINCVSYFNIINKYKLPKTLPFQIFDCVFIQTLSQQLLQIHVLQVGALHTRYIAHLISYPKLKEVEFTYYLLYQITLIKLLDHNSLSSLN